MARIRERMVGVGVSSSPGHRCRNKSSPTSFSSVNLSEAEHIFRDWFQAKQGRLVVGPSSSSLVDFGLLFGGRVKALGGYCTGLAEVVRNFTDVGGQKLHRRRHLETWVEGAGGP